MRTARFCGSGEREGGYPTLTLCPPPSDQVPCEQTHTCKNITFPQLRLRAEITIYKLMFGSKWSLEITICRPLPHSYEHFVEVFTVKNQIL